MGFFSTWFLLGIFSLSSSWAKPLVLLHTNDLHSYFKGIDTGEGGYAQLAQLMTDQRQYWQGQGHQVLSVDGGDFGEGDVYFFAGQGRFSFSILNPMGFDAVVLGNHDYLMGTAKLDEILGDTPLQYNLLAANLRVDTEFKNINQVIQKYKIYSVGEKKVAIIGLTTDEKLYTWRIQKGQIYDPILYGTELSSWLKRKKLADYVIALTHLGVKVDQKLVSRSRDIDLVVGGHSHTRLDKILWQKNIRKRPVAIVQTGSWGRVLGRLKIDVGEELKIHDYTLLPVSQGDAQDPRVTAQIGDSIASLETIYGKENLYTPLGRVDIPMEVKSNEVTPWGVFVAESFRQSIGAEFGMSTPEFHGAPQNPKIVSMKNMMELYPRMFETDRPEGWKVYRMEMFGSLIHFVSRVSEIVGHPIILSRAGGKAMLMDTNRQEFVTKDMYEFDIKGIYSIAVPEGIVRGGDAITSLWRALAISYEETSVSIWSAMAQELQRRGVVR